MQTNISTIIMGGTFDPVHIGHMHLAEEAIRKFRPERFLIVPSYISAHKQGRDTAGAEHRLKMLEIACRSLNAEIETCELDRKGISYSIDTIRYIKEKYGLDKNPGLLIGDDLADGFKDWKDPEKIAEEADLIVAYRDSANEIDFKFRHTRIENLILNVSSSDIRLRLAQGRASRFLMPEGVYDYISENNLYGVDNA